MTGHPIAPFRHLAGRITPGSRLLRAWPLTGGASAQVTALELQGPDGAIRKVVVRVHSDIDFANNPRIAADEYRLLGLLQAAGIPAPAPLYLDESGELFGRPCLVVSFIEGSLELDVTSIGNSMSRMAERLARLHQHPWQEGDCTFLPRIAPRLAWLLDGPLAQDDPEATRIRAALRPSSPLLPRNPATLLHGDYWPGNILWQSGEITAVLDWEDAAWGDPLADLAIARLDLLFIHGPAAMDTFTDCYLSLMPTLDPADLPAWDLYADLRVAFRLHEWHTDPATLEALRAHHRWFVEAALTRLPNERERGN